MQKTDCEATHNANTSRVCSTSTKWLDGLAYLNVRRRKNPAGNSGSGRKVAEVYSKER